MNIETPLLSNEPPNTTPPPPTYTPFSLPPSSSSQQLLPTPKPWRMFFSSKLVNPFSSSASQPNNNNIPEIRNHLYRLSHFNPDEKKKFKDFAASGLYVNVIELYYQLTAQNLPTNVCCHPCGRFGLDDQQIHDLVELILFYVENGNQPRIPLVSLETMRAVNSPWNLPTVDEAFRHQLCRNRLRVGKKLYNASCYCIGTIVLSVVGWFGYVVFPKFFPVTPFPPLAPPPS